MLTDDERRRAADAMLRAERERKPIPQLSKTFPNMEIEDAYRIQDLWAEARIAGGARMVGHKIGLTSRAMQMASKMTEPDYGRILDDALFNDGAQIRADLLPQAPRLEVELAFIMGEDSKGPGARIYDVMRATEFVVPALEIIDYRTEVPRAITDTIADNAAFGAIVVGGRTDPADGRRYPLGRRDAVEERHHRGIRRLGRDHGPSGRRHRLARQQAARRRRQARSAGRSCSPARSRAPSISPPATSSRPITARSAPSAFRSPEGRPWKCLRKTFKRALREGRQQIGLWCSLPGSYAAEIVAGFGLRLAAVRHRTFAGRSADGLAQLQAVAAYDVSAVVRPASNDAVLIKRYLDIGAQTLLIPYVQNAEEAKAAVEATRYHINGIRGVSALTRAT